MPPWRSGEQPIRKRPWPRLNKSAAARILAIDFYKPLKDGKPGKTLLGHKGEELTMPRLRELAAELAEHPEVTTLTVLLNKFQSAAEGRLYGPQAAIGTVVTVPVVILGLLIQKHLVKGFSFGTIRK